MKKALVFIFITLMVTGFVWGQIPSEDKKYSGPDFTVFDMFDLFNAVPTVSTEARYSAWQFDSDIDNYIDHRFFDPEIGTFFFLGGYPAGSNVGDTNYLTPGTSVPNNGSTDPSDFFSNGNYAISLGFGKSIINDMYLAAYFGGSLVNAFGQTTKNAAEPSKYDTYAYYVWRNNLALLFGLNNMGFRLDLIMDNSASDSKKTEDGKDIIGNFENGASLSLNWGASMGQLFPYATVGFNFADTKSYNINGNKASYSSGAVIGFLGGAFYELSEKSLASAELLFGMQFAESYRGNETVAVDFLGEGPHSKGGSYGVGIQADYAYNMDANNVTLSINPNIRTGFLSISNQDSRAGAPDLPKDNFFSISMGFDAGLRFTPGDKFAFYTGVGLRLLEWNLYNQPGGGSDNQTKESSWEFKGIEWENSSLVNGNLGFGMTFNPNQYISIGCGLNSFLDNIVEFNLKDMTAKAGPIWGDNKGNFGSWASGILQNVRLDLTVSIKIPNDGSAISETE